MVAVHLTNYFPENGVIRTSGDAKRIQVGSEFVYAPRETLHFSLNGGVGGHLSGDWSGCKYAILIPLELIFDRIYSLASEDTYILGNLTLPKSSEIICLKNFFCELFRESKGYCS